MKPSPLDPKQVGPTSKNASDSIRADESLEHTDAAHERFAAALAEQHERLLAGRTIVTPAGVSGDDSLDATPLDAAQMDDLADRLLQLEHLRRAENQDDASGLLGAFTSLARDNLPFTSAIPSEYDTLSGRRIGRFEIVSELGRGGLGMVLLAHDPVLNRRVALKLPRPEAILTEQLRQRFRREGQAAARLQHPHIVPVYEVGEVGPICFIAAAYVDGMNLAQWMAARGKPCDPRLAATLVADLADAMQHAHEQRVLHRDLKPSNVLLDGTRADDNGNLGHEPAKLLGKITDFGLAKVLDQAAEDTRHGVVIGTPAYMAPEQARGDVAQIGPPADVFALGAILYELLSGETPHGGSSQIDTLARLLVEEPPQLAQVAASVPRDLASITMHCLERSPTARYQAAGELAADLRRFLAGVPTKVRPLAAPQRFARWARRKPALAALAVVSLLALVTIAVGSTYSWKLGDALAVASNNVQRAETEQARANQRLYASQMKLADIAIHQLRHADAERLLDAHSDGTPTAHLRSAEWYLLKHEVERFVNRGTGDTTFHLPNSEELFCCAFTLDERWLITGGREGVLSIWDIATQELIYQFLAHESCINQLALSADGQYLATSSCDKTVRLWRLDGARCPQAERSFADHQHEVYGVAFSPDGRQLASGDQSGLLLIRDLATGASARHQESTHRINQLRWSPNSRFIVLLRIEQEHFPAETVAYETATGRRLGLNIAAHDWAFEPSQGNEAAAVVGNTVQIIQFGPPPSLTFRGNVEAEELTNWSARKNFMVSGSRGRTFLHDIRQNRALALDSHITTPFETVSISETESWVASLSLGGPIALTDIRPHVARWHPWECKFEPLQIFPAVGLGDTTKLIVPQFREVLVIDPTDETVKRRIPMPQRWLDFFLSTRGETLGVIHGDGIRLVDAATGKSSELPKELHRGGEQLLISDEARLAIVFARERFWVLDRDTLEVRQEIPCDIGVSPTLWIDHRISPNGRYIAIAKPSRSPEFIDLQTLTRRVFDLPSPSSTPRVIGFTADSARICVVMRDSVQIRDCATFEIVQETPVATASTVCAVSPNGRTLVSLDDKSLRLLDIVTGEEMVSCPHVNLRNTNVRFSADGSRVRLIGYHPSNKLLVYEWGKGVSNR